MLYQPLTPAGWAALIAITAVAGVAVALLSNAAYGLIAAAAAFYLASAGIRVWDHRRIRRGKGQR